MANIIRSDEKDYGGWMVWSTDDPDRPVYISEALSATCFSDGQINAIGEALVDEVLADRQLATSKEALLDKIAAARSKIDAQLDSFFSDAKDYVEENYPGVTDSQLKTAFVNQLKTWVANWSGD
jgi:hypothetical protein